MSDGANPEKEFRYGQIILAEFTDRNGFRKTRPGVVLTPTAQVRRGQPLVVMAITSTFRDPPPRWHVELPWNPDPRKVRTGLVRRSAAVVSWVETMWPANIQAVKGHVPAAPLKLIERAIDEWFAERGDGPD